MMNATSLPDFGASRDSLPAVGTTAETSFDENVRRVIVIDDNPAIHTDFRKVLLGNTDEFTVDDIESALFGQTRAPQFEINYEIAHALQGQEGFEKVVQSVKDNRPFDLAFVDMRMPPGWDGLETIENLWKIAPSLQVVICSAYSDHPLQEIRNRIGHNDQLFILKKPFEKSEVNQMAAALTEKCRLTQRVNRRIKELERLAEQYACDARHSCQTDKLTGLLNAHGLNEVLHRCPDILSNASTLTVEVADLKQLKVEHGHRVRDEVVREVSRQIQEQSRNGDIIVRLDSDEFLMIQPSTDPKVSGTIAEELKQFFSDEPLRLDNRSIDVRLNIGISFGNVRDYDTLLAQSAQALFEANQAR